MCYYLFGDVIRSHLPKIQEKVFTRNGELTKGGAQCGLQQILLGERNEK